MAVVEWSRTKNLPGAKPGAGYRAILIFFLPHLGKNLLSGGLCILGEMHRVMCCHVLGHVLHCSDQRHT